MRIRFDFKLSCLHLLDKKYVRQITLLFVAFVALGIGFAWHVVAQSGESPWTQPVNVSQSGAASRPVIAVVPDGTLHVLWWDAIDGEQYAQTTGVTGTTWTEPLSVEAIVGERKVNEQTGRVTLTPPRNVRLVSDVDGAVHAFWFGVYDQLVYAQTLGGWWSGATVVADSAIGMDVAADENGTLHVAYIRPWNSPGNPSGVYYRTTAGFGWSVPVLVYASTYFRTIESSQAHVSIASDGQGDVVVVWDDPKLGQSFYAHSTNEGQSWSEPQQVSIDQAAQVLLARTAFAPGGDFFLLWHDARTGGCGLSQRRSNDGGQTWSSPERVLSGLSRCPDRWQFMLGSSTLEEGQSLALFKLWLVGTFQSGTTSGGAGVLAAWDGKAWSEPTDVSLSFRHPEADRTVSLGCLGIGVAGQSVGVAGCDANGDVWAARNAVSLDNLATILKPVWSAPQMLSEQNTQEAGLPALAADDKGKLYTVWSESPAAGQPGAALYAAAWDGSRWSRAAQVLRSPSVDTGLVPGAQAASKAEQPALTADNFDRLHAVWSGGTGGEVFYSWTYVRDATSPQAWSQPVALPAPTLVGSWPDILADPRGDVLHVVYAVPYNEARGIYSLRSDDGGATWLAPTLVFDAVAAGWNSVDKPRVALDAYTGVLHAVWLRGALPGGTSVQAVFYARSTDDGQTWSAPLKIAEGAVDWPRIASVEGQVHLVWNQARARGGSTVLSAEVWQQFSLDDGQRWSEPARVRGFEEVSGPASLAAAGEGLYLIAAGQGEGGESALLYAPWTGQAWGEGEIFGLGQNITPGNAAVAAVLPEKGWLGVALREFVLGQAGTAQFEVVATGREVPAVPVTPAPTFTPLPTQTPAPTSTPLPTPTDRPQLRMTGTPQPVQSGPLAGQEPLIVSGALAALVVAVVVLGRIVWGSRK